MGVLGWISFLKTKHETIMHLSDFIRKNQLKLLPPHRQQILLGEIVQTARWCKPRLNPTDTSNTIYQYIHSEGLISKSTFANFSADLKMHEDKLIPVHQLHIRNLDKIQNHLFIRLRPFFPISKIMSYRIQNVTYHGFSSEETQNLLQHIDQLPKHKRKTFFQKCHKQSWVAAVYYGQLKIFIEKQHAKALEIAAEKAHLDLNRTNKGEFIYEYDLNKTFIPFAYKLFDFKSASTQQ